MKLKLFNVNRLEDSINIMQSVCKQSLHDPETRRLAMCVTKGCNSRDDLCEINEWFKFIKKHVKYVSDPRNIDTFQTLERTLQFGGGDCDDLSIALNAGLESIGFETKFRVIQSKGSETWNHVYSLVMLPKRNPTGILPLDLTLSHSRLGVQPPASVVMKFKDFKSIPTR